MLLRFDCECLNTSVSVSASTDGEVVELANLSQSTVDASVGDGLVGASNLVACLHNGHESVSDLVVELADQVGSLQGAGQSRLSVHFGGSIAHALVFNEASSNGVVLLQDEDLIPGNGGSIIVRGGPVDLNFIVVQSAISKFGVHGLDGARRRRSLSGGHDGGVGLRASSINVSSTHSELVLLLESGIGSDVVSALIVLDDLPAKAIVLFEDVLSNRRVTGSNGTDLDVVPVHSDLVGQHRDLLVKLGGLHLGGSLSHSSTVLVGVEIRPRSSASSVSGLNSDLDNSVEGQVVKGLDLRAGSFLTLGPEKVHGDLAVDAVEDRVVLEVGLSVAGSSGFKFAVAVLDFDVVALDARSVASSLFERDLQSTLFRLNRGLYWRNLRWDSGSLDLVGLFRELTPSPSVTASNLVVHVLRSGEVLLLVDGSSRDEVLSRSDKLLPVGVAKEVRRAQRSRARDVPEVVALDRGASIKVSSDGEPLNLDGAFLI